MKKMQFFLLTLIVAFSAACTPTPFFDPKPPFLQTELDYGPEEFRLGYNHGCESALSAYGNNMQKSFYSLHKEPKYETNRMYNQAWKDAWAYCYMWLFVQGQKDPLVGRSLL